jgi:soluble calcium-activated nucleotidase 1
MLQRLARSAGFVIAFGVAFHLAFCHADEDTKACEATFCPPCPTPGYPRSGSSAPDTFAQAPMYYEHSVSRILNTRSSYLTYIEGEYHFGVVADLDLLSRDPQEFIWRSYLKKGRLVRVSQRAERELFTISFDEELVLSSSTATRNRSMELSEMVRYNRNLIAFCDYSGIAYKIDPVTGNTFQRWAIADGNGDEAKPFKGEWATVKDDQVWLGSIGFEWYGSKGEILHRNAEWVKIVDGGGTVRNLNWHPVYQAVRSITNTTLPGYLWHEAVEWEPVQKIWVMLPRFASNTSRYMPGKEHEDTSNLLIVANEGFTNIRVTRLAHHDQRYGFTSVKRLPGSQHLFMVLRVHEDGNNHHTQAAVLDLDGNFYTDPPYIEVGSRKFEGLAFLPGPV